MSDKLKDETNKKILRRVEKLLKNKIFLKKLEQSQSNIEKHIDELDKMSEVDPSELDIPVDCF